MPGALSFSLRGVLCLFACMISLAARAETVWIALSSNEPVYQETASAIRAALPNDDVRIGEWGEFNFRIAPQVVVTVGGEALRQLQRSAGKTRLIALLVPRSTLDEFCDTATAGRVSGVYYEQPFSRQASLLRAAFPDKSRVGIVLGPASARYRQPLAHALTRAGLQGVFEVVQNKSELAEAVQNVLANSDVFLALPDTEVINSQSAKFILLASYRRAVPVVGYSASFVKAGAVLAMVSSPEQIGKEAAQLINDVLSGKRLPAARAPEDFDVLVNASVARSLNLNLDPGLLEQRIRAEGRGR